MEFHIFRRINFLFYIYLNRLKKNIDFNTNRKIKNLNKFVFFFNVKYNNSILNIDHHGSQKTIILF